MADVSYLFTAEFHSFFNPRYISSQGWAGGPYPISIPKSLRSALQDTSDPQAGGTGAARTSNWDNNSKKEARSVFDLVGHLCGRPVPGIPLASTLPLCPIDRVRQIHWMYCTLLTFLRCVGLSFVWCLIRVARGRGRVRDEQEIFYGSWKSQEI